MKRFASFSICLPSVLLLVLLFSPFLQPALHAATDSQLRAEIGPNKSYVILENSQIYVKYEPFAASSDGHEQFGIKELKIKSAGNENQTGYGKYNYMDADAGRWKLASVSKIYDGSNRKTVRLVWYGRNNDPNKKITHEVSIFPDSRYLKIKYVDVKYGLNIVDLGEPGGTISGKHVAYGHNGWIRDYITHTYPEYHGSYYNRYPGDGVNDPANGGSLNYNRHFILGVYNPANGRGFARVMPVADIDIVKLLLETYKRRGLELFPHPFGKSHDPFTGYLYVVTGGASEILSVGKQLADGNSVPSPPPPDPETEYDLTASVIGGHGGVSPTSGTYAEGIRVTLTARPDPGYCVLEWNGTNNDSSTSNTNTVTMNSDKTVTVEFTSNCEPAEPAQYDLLVSTSPDRTSAVPLDGQTVSGDIYVFTSPDDGVDRVTFYLDSVFHQQEGFPPYDFKGTNNGTGFAAPWDTTQLADGQYEIAAEIQLTDGTIEEVTAAFRVANGSSSQYSLLVSRSPDRTSAVPLDGQSVSGDIYVFTSPDDGVDRVTFYLDSALHRAENFPPYDFEGTAGNGLANPWNTALLADGRYEITAEIELTDGTVERITATFTVNN